jgi:hypothetical protein
MRFLFLLLPLFYLTQVNAQGVDPDLLKIKSRMDSVQQFSASIKLDVDISFINMPTKYAKMNYTKGKPIQFSSDDFVMIPKKGLDFSLSNLFEYPFITVDRGVEKRKGKTVKAIHVIPTDKKADFSIATLFLDVENTRIAESEISTKKDGSYLLEMSYENNTKILPSQVGVSFEMDRIKIPFNFMGKDTDIDRKKMRTAGPKSGKIFLTMSNYQIKMKGIN